MAIGLPTQTVRVGVDVGGTNTDAVILDPTQQLSASRGVIASHKTATTSPDVTDGIEEAVRTVLKESKVPSSLISCVTIGTTHFINAVVEHDASRLSKVAVIRLSTSYTRDIPPFTDFPRALKSIMNGYCGYVNGGLQIDGIQESPIVTSQVEQVCDEIKARGLSTIVICGVFSPIDTHFKQEDQVRKIVLQKMPSADVVCSSEVANLGFLERENAAILNASILKFARRTIKGFRAAMKRLHLHCPLYLTQNDGTLIDANSAARLPIRTFSSGATNSMRGAAYLGLSGSESLDTCAIVVDIGGTTSDVGVLLPSGYPRQASAFTTVAGIRINYNMPHVESIGLGGGSIIGMREDGNVSVGPESVGYRLTKMAKVFGGYTLTATDIAVAHNPDILIGNPGLVEDVPLETVARARKEMKIMLERVIDKMKTSPDPLPVLLVGGGSEISPDDLEGVSELIRPPFHSVANAVGAAISKVGSTVDIIQSTATQTVAEALELAKVIAMDRAVAAGASRNSIVVTEMESLPLQYVEHRVRTVVRVAGDLSATSSTLNGVSGVDEECCTKDDISIVYQTHDSTSETSFVPQNIYEILTYRPKIIRSDKSGISEWIVSETDLIWLADGCYVLGCAGGGTPHPEFLKLRDQVREGHIIRIIEPSALEENAVVYWGGNMGSPAVSAERLSAGEILESIHEMMHYMRHDSFDAVMSVEIGGGNGLQPLLWGSSKNFDRPIVDADFMGRAYPNYWQNTLTAHESGQLVPCAIASGNGKSLIMTRTDEDLHVDRVLRAPCVEMGSFVGMCGKPTSTERVLKYSVRNTLSQAWRIGRCIHRAMLSNTISTVAEQIIEEVGGPESAKLLFRGKIIGVERKLIKGHSYGEIVVEQLADDQQDGANASTPIARGGLLKIPFKNENIYAKHVADDGAETVVAMVPDLIAVLDVQTGKALGVPEFRYGVIVQVLGISASPGWTQSPRGVEIGGPGAFGFDFPYKPLGKYVEPRSVIEEFS